MRSSAFAHYRRRWIAAIPGTRRRTHFALPLTGALTLACACTCACNEPIDFTLPGATVSNPASGPTWYGPYALDLGDIRDSTKTTFYSTNAAFFPSAAAYTYSQSYGTFHLEASSSFGAMAASFYDGLHFRPFGRIYHPFSQGGSGWAPYGPQAGFLDASSSLDALYMTMGLSPAGAGLVLFADGASTANTQDALLRSAGSWNGLSAQIGLSLVSNTKPGQGYVPKSNGTAGIYANGSSHSVAWDAGNHAYYSYVDQNDPNFVSYIDTYAAFTTWASDWITDPVTGKSNGIRLGPLTSQTQLLNDGFGVTPLWVGQDLLTASSLSMGSQYGCALNSNGLFCWGSNGAGQTGIGNAQGIIAFPTQVGGLNGNINSVSAGYTHACALMQAGKVLCWGANLTGQVGNGTTSSNQVSPSIVTGLPGSAQQVAAGHEHTCALVGGKVYCWGDNNFGQQGTGGISATPVTSPSTQVMVLSGVEQISAGSHHTCALAAGKVSCWGNNSFGEVGNGGMGATVNSPVDVGLSGVQQIEAKGTHTCALLTGGTVYCWGYNLFGQVGNGNNVTPINVPTQVLSAPATPLTNVKQIALGYYHTCALQTSGQIVCWGDNSDGELGNGAVSAVPVTTPVTVKVPAGVSITAIAAGDGDTYAITNQGTVLCWGYNADGECNGNDYNNGITTELTPLELAASSNQTLHATWSTASNFQAFTTLSTGDVKSMSAATDGQGNVLALYLQTQPGFVQAPSGTISTPYPVRGNDVRVYASMRGASGIWTAPTQIDDASQFVPTTTTTYQEAWGRLTNNASDVTGGIEYYTPGVAYLGSGRFLAAFAMTDVANSTSSIYVRGYTVGVGWDPSTQTYQLDSMSFAKSATTEAFRYANDLTLVGDGQGDALLVAQVVIPSDDGSNVTLRNYGMKAFVYSSAQGGWSNHPLLIPNSICRTPSSVPSGFPSKYFCWGLKPQGMIFPGPEAVVVYPAPAGTDTTTSSQLRLFTTELRQ